MIESPNLKVVVPSLLAAGKRSRPIRFFRVRSSNESACADEESAFRLLSLRKFQRLLPFFGLSSP